MKIFFDTEFTGLTKDTTLISIGLVDENGRTFYAELNDYDTSHVNEWIKTNVIDNLKFNKYSANLPGINFGPENNVELKSNKLTVQTYLTKWLDPYDEVELVSDVCHYDMVLFIDIFGSAFDIPANVNASCHDINQDIAKYYNISETEAFDLSREDILSDNRYIVDDEIMKHNALYDATVIKEIFYICNKIIKND